MPELLQQAILKIKLGDKRAGLELLTQVLRTDPKNESAWLWMSSVLGSLEQQRRCLTKALEINPNSTAARKGLAKLEAALGPADPPALIKSQLPPTTTTPEITAWINEGTGAAKVILLYDDVLVAVSPQPKAIDLIQAELDAGRMPPKHIFGDHQIQLSQVAKVTTPERGNSLHVQYTLDNRPAFGSIKCLDQEQRDELWSGLEKKLGPEFKCTVQQHSALQATFFSIVVMALIAIATWLLFGAAVQAAAGGDPALSGRYYLFELLAAEIMVRLGPTGVLAVGGFLLALVAIWMVRRILNPTIKITLAPESEAAG